MILEVLAWALTPAEGPARRMGFLREQISIAARRARCRQAWAPHLERSKAAILGALDQVPAARRKTALILGSGHLFDLPLDELTRAFERVLLVDLIQPWRARLGALFRPRIELIEHDATEALGALEAAVAAGGALPDIRPARFLDDPEIGLVVSLNLVSQLPYVPLRYLDAKGSADEAAREAFGRRLVERHLDYLRAFAARGAVTLLIGDVERIAKDKAGAELGRVSAVYDAAFPEGGEEWFWDICPIPEFDPARAIVNRVRATLLT
jgi:hypothetical protein